MSRDQELCSFFCINGQRPNVDDIVDVIVKLDTCEIHVAAKLASLSCMHTPTVQLPGQQLSATADSDSRPTVSDSVRQMSDSV